jgi:hypothetical protein
VVAVTGTWTETGPGRSVFRPAGQPAPRPAGGYADVKVSPDAVRRVMADPMSAMLMELWERRGL